MTLKFFSDKPILPPDFSLSVKLIEGIPEKAFVAFAEVIVVSGQYFFGSGHGVEGLPVIANFKAADSEISQGKGIGGEMLDCFFIALDGFFVVALVFVNIAKIVVSIAVSWIDLNCFFVPGYRVFSLAHPLINDGNIVVS